MKSSSNPVLEEIRPTQEKAEGNASSNLILRRFTRLRQPLVTRSLMIVSIGALSSLCASCQDREVAQSPTTEATVAALSEVPVESGNPSSPLDDPFKGTVLIPAGFFSFGASEEQFKFYVGQSILNFSGMIENLRKTFITPPKMVKLPDYHIDRFEVTNQQYGNFVAATGYRSRDGENHLKHWKNSAVFPNWAATFPVVWVSQQDAQEYCRWRQGRLPTEEEWEKAARGPKGGYYPWGNRAPNKATANFGSDAPEPVGNRPKDRSPYQVYDLGGNVAELTGTIVRREESDTVVVRGGSFLGISRETLTYQRGLAPLLTRSASTGFRCVVEKP